MVVVLKTTMMILLLSSIIPSIQAQNVMPQLKMVLGQNRVNPGEGLDLSIFVIPPRKIMTDPTGLSLSLLLPDGFYYKNQTGYFINGTVVLTLPQPLKEMVTYNISLVTDLCTYPGKRTITASIEDTKDGYSERSTSLMTRIPIVFHLLQFR